MNKTLKILRHSASHLLAVAVNSLFPKAQLVSGEETSLGFYYDFFFPEPIHAEQLSVIEERMRDFIRQDLPIKMMEMMRKNAIEFFKHHQHELKVLLLKSNVETLVHVCQIGQFYDLGNPPFVQTTKQIGVIKLLDINTFNISLPGRPNITLTRIQGIAFPDNSSLKQFLKKAEAAKAVDHRVLGKKMQLFTHFEQTCSGCWTWLPKGMVLRNLLLDWWYREHRLQKYQLVSTPFSINSDMLQKAENRKFEDRSSGLIPIKAPLHALLFKSQLHSYKELPIRTCEFSEFCETEKESHLWGLFRCRVFNADCGYIFCLKDQVLPELISSLQFIEKNFKMLGFETHWYLIAKNTSFKGSAKKWNESQDILTQAMSLCHLDFIHDTEENVSYGPRVELRVKDALGREWKGPYVYIDLSHPEKFGLHYQGQEDRMHPPVMIGRSIFGSLERLTALLIEHYAGVLPLWLAPEQIRVIPVGERNIEYAVAIQEKLEEAGFRVRIEKRDENLGAKIHSAKDERIPYIVVVGAKEEENKTISLRRHLQEDVQEELQLETLLEQLKKTLDKTKRSV